MATATVVIGTIMVLGAGSATATTTCQQPTAVGNATVSAADTTVGVGQSYTGTTNQNATVCSDSYNSRNQVRTTVDLTPYATGQGVKVVTEACSNETIVGANHCGAPVEVGAKVVPPSTVTPPSPTVDRPQDGNGYVGASTGTGSTVCITAKKGTWSPVPPSPNCGSYRTAGGDVSTDVDPVRFVNHMTTYYLPYLLLQGGAVNEAAWCINQFFLYHWVDAAQFCAIGTSWLVSDPLIALLGCGNPEVCG